MELKITSKRYDWRDEMKFYGSMEEIGYFSIGKNIHCNDADLYPVIGAKLAKKKLKNMFDYSDRFKDIFEEKHIRPEIGLIIYGPPGVGKSMLAKTSACEYKKKCGSDNVKVIYYKASDYVSSGTGKSAKKLNILFNSIKYHMKKTNCIIAIFEEVEILLPKRKGKKTGIVGTERTTAFLQEIDEVLDDKNLLGRLFIIGTTNQPQYIDPAIFRSGRFRITHVNLPTKEERSLLIKMYWRDLNLKFNPYYEENMIDEYRTIKCPICNGYGILRRKANIYNYRDCQCQRCDGKGRIKYVDKRIIDVIDVISLCGLKTLADITDGFSPADIAFAKRDLLTMILLKEEKGGFVIADDIISVISIQSITSKKVLEEISIFSAQYDDMLEGGGMTITDIDIRDMLQN